MSDSGLDGSKICGRESLSILGLPFIARNNNLMMQ